MMTFYAVGLKHLELISYCNEGLTEKFVYELQLPRLETLCLNIQLKSSVSYEVTDQIMEKLY